MNAKQKKCFLFCTQKYINRKYKNFEFYAMIGSHKEEASQAQNLRPEYLILMEYDGWGSLWVGGKYQIPIVCKQK